MQTAYSEVETGREELQKAEISQVQKNLECLYVSLTLNLLNEKMYLEIIEAIQKAAILSTTGWIYHYGHRNNYTCNAVKKLVSYKVFQLTVEFESAYNSSTL